MNGFIEVLFECVLIYFLLIYIFGKLGNVVGFIMVGIFVVVDIDSFDRLLVLFVVLVMVIWGNDWLRFIFSINEKGFLVDVGVVVVFGLVFLFMY